MLKCEKTANSTDNESFSLGQMSCDKELIFDTSSVEGFTVTNESAVAAFNKPLTDLEEQALGYFSGYR